MTKLIPIVFASMVLAIYAHLSSERTLDSYGNTVYVKKNRVLFVIMAVAMIFFVGLRTNYNDTTAYTHGYELINIDMDLDDFSWKIGANPGFNWINLKLKQHGTSTQSFLMFYAAITLAIYIWFIRKYTDDIILTVFLFITMGCYTFTLAAVKQCAAVAFCLIATDFGIRKKYIPMVILILIGTLIHPYSLMYLAVPFLSFRPWSKIGYAMVAIFVIVGVMLSGLITTVLDITTLMGEEYDAESFVGEGVNIFRVAVVWVPVFLSWFARKHYEGHQKEHRARNIIMNLATLNACIMFVGLFGTANYFARLANYFLVFQVLALPTVLRYYENKNQIVLKTGAFLGYSAYFYYAEAIANGSFDVMYRAISIRSYLSI